MIYDRRKKNDKILNLKYLQIKCKLWGNESSVLGI